MTLLLATLPTLLVGLVLMLCERIGGAPRGDWLRNLQSWAVQLAAAVAILPLMPLWRGAALLDGARLPFWLGCLIFLVARDLGEYLFHRAQHRVPWLWAMHSLHHSDPEMSVLTTSRHYWGDQLFKTITVWSLSAMIISPTPAALVAYSVLSLWNYFTHSRKTCS